MVKITRVVVALIFVAVILVGLPLVAWWLGNRRFWSRLRPSPTPVLQDDLRQRLGLTATELAQVRLAARRGSALADPRLRTAVVTVAEQSIEQQRHVLIVGRAAGILAVLALVAGLVLGEFRAGASVISSVVWALMIANLLIQAGTAILVDRRFRQAIRLNSGPVLGEQS